MTFLLHTVEAHVLSLAIAVFVAWIIVKHCPHEQ